ncbi:hypothetical protein PV327_009542 [Microctonus hyperodae]|uniref:Gustatory receptor n=1 Tax=Microctonus hyperodae TaxID=165561 RepID=A0AA39F1N7_MICHY|nr:hypothetical protein PV327_009542 [Microctonus hyperodae]
MGLAPFNIKILNNKFPIFTNSYLGSLYNLILIIFLSTVNISAINTFYYDDTPTLSKFHQSIQSIITFYGNLVGIVIWIIYIFRQKTFVNIANKFLLLDNVLIKCQYYSHENDNQIFFLFLGNIFYIILAFIFNTAYFHDKSSIIYSAPVFVSGWAMMQYSLLLSEIFERLKSLNKYLKLGNISTKIPLHIIFVKKFPLESSVISDIINLRYSYRVLCEICDEVEEFFAFPILISVLFFGLSTIHSIYTIILTFFNNSEWSTDHGRAASLTWFIAELYKIFALNVSVTRVVREGKHTARSIHLLLDRCVTSYEIDEELTEFSRELLQRKIEFNVYGMFSLDYTVLYITPGIINSWAMMQYSLSLSGIFERMRSLNKTYLKLGNISTKIPLRILFVRKIPLEQSVIDDIINLRKAYRILYEICDQIEELFALPTLLSIIFFGSSAVHSIYTIMLSLCVKMKIDINQMRFSTGIWIILQCYNIIVLTINVTRTVRESKRTVNSIHLLLDRCTIDSVIEEELTEFSTELLHQKITFSVFGMFLLDCSLLYSVAGTIVTYLIILVQFQLK